MAFAAVEVSAALLLFLWGWSDIRRDALGLQLVFLLVGYSVTAALFLFGGRRDRRTRLLGAYFLLQATLANPFVFLGLLLELPPTEPFGIAAAGYPYVFPVLFAPVCLWAFARECPGCIAEPGSTTSRGGWSRSAWWPAASCRSGAWR